MGESAPGAKDRPDATSVSKPTAGLSQFISKILDQLSLSAWLPAAMLIAGLAVMSALHNQLNESGHFDISLAIEQLSDRSFGFFLLLLLLLILTTLVTQAFEFEVIRLLEGYWDSFPGMSLISGLRVQHHAIRACRLERKHDACADVAHRNAALEMRTTGVPEDVIKLLEANQRGERLRLGLVHRRRNKAALALGWRPFCRPYLLQKLDTLAALMDEYPEPHRILPTRLGNILRAAEDLIDAPSRAHLEGLVIRNWDGAGKALQQEHDQYRTRLDMYCILVLVYGLLSIAALTMLMRWPHEMTWGITTSIVFAALGWLSYQSAIASARGYRVALLAIAAGAPTSRKES